MPGRHTEDNYRYAYQGQEKDPETGKEAFELRLWDSRIGRWLTTDPAGQFHSPYNGMGNNPINGVDPDGAWVKGAGFWNNLFHSDSQIYQNDFGYTAAEAQSIVNGDLIHLDPVNLFAKRSPSFVESFPQYEGINTEQGVDHSSFYISGVQFKRTDSWTEAAASHLQFALPSANFPNISFRKTPSVNRAPKIKSIGAAARNSKNIKILNSNVLKKQGIDAHALKHEFLGKNAKISRYDLYKHTDTSEILILQKGGKGDPIFTGEFID